jgi:hypothetical protein
MGAVGGGIWHGIKGARNSPRVCEFSVPHWGMFLTSHGLRVNASLALFPPSKPVHPSPVATLVFGVVCSPHLTVL